MNRSTRNTEHQNRSNKQCYYCILTLFPSALGAKWSTNPLRSSHKRRSTGASGGRAVTEQAKMTGDVLDAAPELTPSLHDCRS